MKALEPLPRWACPGPSPEEEDVLGAPYLPWVRLSQQSAGLGCQDLVSEEVKLLPLHDTDGVLESNDSIRHGLKSAPWQKLLTTQQELPEGQSATPDTSSCLTEQSAPRVLITYRHSPPCTSKYCLYIQSTFFLSSFYSFQMFEIPNIPEKWREYRNNMPTTQQ